MKISTVMSTAVFSLFSKIFCNIDALLWWIRPVNKIKLDAGLINRG
ncbi:MAG: hypothetical protein M0Z99_27075 [Betaproteobacteria bacterium]|nr:hypothetical protein [Betaproteobacteria bacterium]